MKILLPKGFKGALDIEPYASEKYKYAKKYDCPQRDIDKNNINYKYVKDKL